MIHADPGVPCTVGSRVTVGHRVILHGCTIEDDCLIGMGAIILNRVRVGRGSIVGAGAVLLEGMEVPPGSLVVGLPAKVVRPVDEAAAKLLEHGWRHYVEAGPAASRGGIPDPAASRQGRGVSPRRPPMSPRETRSLSTGRARAGS